MVELLKLPSPESGLREASPSALVTVAVGCFLAAPSVNGDGPGALKEITKLDLTISLEHWHHTKGHLSIKKNQMKSNNLNYYDNFKS